MSTHTKDWSCRCIDLVNSTDTRAKQDAVAAAFLLTRPGINARGLRIELLDRSAPVVWC